MQAKPKLEKRLRGSAAVKRRASWLARHPLCVSCLKDGAIIMGEEVDHIVPLYKGGRDIEANLQTLCKRHHDAKTRQDMGWVQPAPGCDASGYPVDPMHHWNR